MMQGGNNNLQQQLKQQQMAPQQQNQQQMMFIIGQLQQELNAIVIFIRNINPEDVTKEEKIGEVLYDYILKIIEVFSFNTINKPEITNQVISMKLTGILLQSDASLLDIVSDFNYFLQTIRDLIFRIYFSSG